MNGLLAHVDLGRALLAIVISLALFAVVQNERNPPETGSFEVPVALVNVPAGLLILGGPPATTVQIRVSAPRESWVSMRPSALRAQVDLRLASVGVNEYPVAVEPPDSRIRVVDVIPPKIPVRLDENIERAVPVRLNRTGNVPFGYDVGEAEIDPPTVAVQGAASVVRQLENAVVDIRLEGVSVDVEGRFTATPVDAQGQIIPIEGRGIRVTPAAVRVRIPISQQLSYKTVGVQPTIVGTVQSGHVIEGVTTEPSVVTIVGPPRALASVNFAETERIDVADANVTIARQVAIVVPEGTTVLQQGVARVAIRIAPLTLTQSLNTVPVVEGVEPGLQVTSALPTVQVVLQGPATALRAVGPEGLQARVSLRGLTAGTHQVTVDVEPPPGLTLQSVNPRVIQVTIASVGPAPTAGVETRVG